MDSAVCHTNDPSRCGYTRCGVYRDDFEKMLKAFERLVGPFDADVTWRRLMLGSRDSTTGWYEPFWETSTIKMIIISRGASSMVVDAGVYVRLDAVGRTQTPVQEGDQIFVEGSRLYYEVKSAKPMFLLGSFSHYECDLTLLPLHKYI